MAVYSLQELTSTVTAEKGYLYTPNLYCIIPELPHLVRNILEYFEHLLVIYEGLNVQIVH